MRQSRPLAAYTDGACAIRGRRRRSRMRDCLVYLCSLCCWPILSADRRYIVSVTSDPSRAGTRSARLEEGGRPAGLSAPCEQSPTATVHRRLVVGRNLHAAARLRFLHSAVRRPGRGESRPGRVEGSHWLGAVLVTGRAGRPRKRAVLATASLTKVSSRTPGATLLKRGVGASADT